MRGTGVHGDVPGSHIHKLASGGKQDAKILLRGWKSSKVPRQASVHRRGLGIKGPSQGQAERGVGAIGPWEGQETVGWRALPYLGSAPS